MYPANALEANESSIDITGIIFGMGSMIIVAVIVLFLLRIYADYRTAKLAADRDEKVRQLVTRYEHLAESTLDAQQRAAADLAELRNRMAGVEQILRTVDQP